MCQSDPKMGLLAAKWYSRAVPLRFVGGVSEQRRPMAEKNRDEFTEKTKLQIAKGAGWLCSDPSCRRPTIGSNSDGTGEINLGIAAHICAAAPGGPRYDPDMTREQRQWLYEMAKRYETNPYDWDAFMARVDIVPPSLAIAQAAEESGWGTSRFAREGNALFGQYTYKASNGILPEERANGRHHLIRAYSSLVEGVRSYMHNLNYHRAYGEFRSARKWLRAHAKPMDGHTLAGELIRYSERGAAYVETIRHIIRANKLSPLDDARLHEDRWTQHDPAMPGRHS